MTALLFNRVFETTTTTGTGAVALTGVTGFHRFSDVLSVAQTCPYAIVAVDGNGNPSGDWECGIGTYSSANTLTRTTVEESTNANAAVNFAAGSKHVYLSATAGALAPLLDGELAALGGLTSAADRLPYFTGSSTASLATFTAAGRALVDDADAAAQRATLGLGSIATEAEATAAQIQAGTASKAVAADKLLASAAPQTLTDAAPTAWDMSLGYNAKWTLGASRTLSTPTNPLAGMTYCLNVIQDGTGSRIVTWPSAFDWGTTGAPTLTTTASKRDRISLFCTDAATPKFDAFLSGKGFS